MRLCSHSMRKTSLLFVLVILMIASAGLFGWSFYQLGDKVSSETCTSYRPIEWPNGDYCGWKVWPNSVIRLASSAISLTVALLTTYAVAKDIRFALIMAIVIYIVSAATLLASTIIDAFSVTATKDSSYCLTSGSCDLTKYFITPVISGIMFLITAPFSAALIFHTIAVNRKLDRTEVDPQSYQHLIAERDYHKESLPKKKKSHK
eukprot:TRINITY_DN557_c0_g1_i1.p1 TRINITY_DN557_c0_g1~~TRINITY_DN557_c0_g1_i1.p1  ORF type:complete len:205 (-),score=33.39 TRINITY_DN557_c0_g1_i1:245-859(-)